MKLNINMKSLKSFLECEIGCNAATPGNTLGMGNPGVIDNTTLSEPIKTKNAKSKKEKPKKLQESILDDEEVLINKAIEDSYWAKVYELLKSKKEVEAAKILNDKLKPCKYGEWRKDTALFRGEQVVIFYKDGAGCGPMRISNVVGKEQLKFGFCDLAGNIARNDFYEFYGIKYDDFRNKFRENLIKELGLKKASSVSDNWIMEF
jgi:hypothetical protein